MWYSVLSMRRKGQWVNVNVSTYKFSKSMQHIQLSWNKKGFMNKKREYDTERVKEKENAKKGRERGK